MLKSRRLMELRWMRIVAAACMFVVAMGTLAASRPWHAQGPQMGPRDVADIPIESVPAWASESVARILPREGYGGIEVLAVLRDPRDVPIDRFLYALTDDGGILVHPEAEAIRHSFEGEPHSAVAVYVRVTAITAEVCEECNKADPFFVDSMENIERNPDTLDVPWNDIGVAYDVEGASVLPCLEPMTIDRRARSFTTPDTGSRIRPDEYLPPMPQYVVTNNRSDPALLQGEMTEGEVREGWLLCLAPDMPVDEVRIVTGHGHPMWMPVQEMAIGEWYLLEDRQVLGWNEDPAQVREDSPIHLDEQVVYEGDVWVSVGQALRFIYDPYVDRDGIAVEPFEEQLRLQMYFAGIEELLTRWDQLALQDGMQVSIVNDLQIPWVPGGGGGYVDLRAQGTSTSVGSSSLIVDEGRYTGPHAVLWVYPVDIDEPQGIGPIPVWRAEFEEIDERNLTTDAICIVTECVIVPMGPIDRQVDTAVPAIPMGVRALGLTVLSTRFVQPPILRARGLDVFVEQGRSSDITGSWKWLVAEVSSEGIGSTVSAINLQGDAVASGEFPFGAEQNADFGVSGGRVSFGNEWLSYVRSGRNGLLLVSEIRGEWRLDDVVLLASTGPAWRLE